MQISKLLIWQAVAWPGSANASQYAVFVNGSSSASYTATGGTTSALVTYDDSVSTVFQIRPTDGTLYGAAQTVVYSDTPMPNRAWLRGRVRKVMADRNDDPNATSPALSDDELNDYINDAIRNYGQYFPHDRDHDITMTQNLRDYALPNDCLDVSSVEYDRPTTLYKKYLKEKPYKGGESTAESWFGFAKLGIMQYPMQGRFYGGNYDVYENTLHLDFDPWGDDMLHIRYKSARTYPVSDLDTIDVPENDLEMLLLYIEAKCWLFLEGKDVLLSRWRGKEDGGRRDDMPTERMSTRLFNAWNQWLRERRNMTPRNLRLVRR